MNAEPWNMFSSEEIRIAADSAPPPEQFRSMLRSFAMLKEAEQRGERCVLPKEVACKQIDTAECFKGGWSAWESGTCYPRGNGETQESAILDLARKLREQ